MRLGDKFNTPSIVQRFEAAANTFVPVALFALVLTVLLNTVLHFDHYLRESGVSEVTSDRLTGLAIFGVPIIWLAIDGARHRATWGMRKRSLIFLKADGQEMSLIESFIRIILGIALMPLFPFSIITILRDSHGRTITDFLCGTISRVLGDDSN